MNDERQKATAEMLACVHKLNRLEKAEQEIKDLQATRAALNKEIDELRAKIPRNRTFHVRLRNQGDLPPIQIMADDVRRGIFGFTFYSVDKKKSAFVRHSELASIQRL
jgi:tRNA(Ser,Leu) C12 N-acetylase TAN1